MHPKTHILTSKDHPHAALQRAGHGDIVETPEGNTYLVHLTGRPTTQERRCVLGRECGLQEAYWEDDWSTSFFIPIGWFRRLASSNHRAPP
jgi:xylan 1,4-beta-xylosidase